MVMSKSIRVDSEIGTLQRLLIHSPDSGLGRVVPSKAQDWLFEDIVHLDTIRKKEYDYYVKLLLYFLDPEKIKGQLSKIDTPAAKRDFYKPEKEQFHRSEKVIELEWLLAEILDDTDIRQQLVAATCAIEGISMQMQNKLLGLTAQQLAKTMISGSLPDDGLLFPPIPNFIFTRDIGIVINEYLLLNKPAKKARRREALIAKYIFFNHPLFENFHENIIEIPDTYQHFLLPRDMDDKKVTLEGGDVMVVSKDHVLIGVSERTSMEAAHQVTKLLFEQNIVKKVSIIRIPKKRDYMHIDTIFTQVKRNVWVMLGAFSKKALKHENADVIERILLSNKKEEKIHITQFKRKDIENPIYFDSLEELLIDISSNDLGVEGKVKMIYSGNNEFPFDSREQWTDSCNVLALKEGVVLGYDRNDKTVDAFKKAGFDIIHVEELLLKFESGELEPQKMTDTLILFPSAELSRARGGFHCMSMPILRKSIHD
jgi:arginine deiminase